MKRAVDSIDLPSLEDIHLIRGAVRAYTTRRVPVSSMRALLRNVEPRSGDLVLARVGEIGQHERLHLPNGAKKKLFVGDHVIVAYGNRYASSQFEALMPRDLRPCHLVAAGGMASCVRPDRSRIQKAPTALEPIGLVASGPEAPPLNVAGWALTKPSAQAIAASTHVVLIVGTAMDSGKTTTAASLTVGLRRLGLRVGYSKITGTGAAGDPMLLADAGAAPVLDFTDVGYVSTYRLKAPVVESIFVDLVELQRAAGVDVAILEIADGLLQAETRALLEAPVVRETVDSVLFAASEAMSAVAGERWLTDRGLPVRALTGRLTSSPLQVLETRSEAHLPVYKTSALADPATAMKIIEHANEALEETA